PASHGTVALVNGVITYTPAADYNGPDSFTYTISDDGTTNGAGDFKTSTATVSVLVTEVNDAPTAVDDDATVAEDGFVVIDVLANDSRGPANESGQTLTVTAASALHGSVTINADGTLNYSPDADYNGEDTITYSIVDNGTTGGASDPKVATATVAI